MKKKISITDIANEFNVSVTTVSDECQSEESEKRVSEYLTKRVLKYVESIGYSPKKRTSHIDSVKEKCFAFIIHDMHDTHAVGLFNCLERIAFDKGYNIITCVTKNDNKRFNHAINQLQRYNVDGVIVGSIDGIQDELQQLITASIPVVLLDNLLLSKIECHTVFPEGVNVAYEGTMYLLKERGANRIGFVTTVGQSEVLKGRLEGYMKAIDTIGMDLLVKKVNQLESPSVIMNQLNDFISLNKLDAVFFATNNLAILGLQTIKEYGLSVDKLVSFEDNPIFTLVEPSVSVISLDLELMAQEAFRLIDDQLQGKQSQIENIVIPCKLIKS